VDAAARAIFPPPDRYYVWAMGKAALKVLPLIDAADDINEALVIYTGYGKSPFPRARSNDLVTRFGPEQGSELKSRILALMEELQQPIHDEKRSKKSVTERAIEQLRPRHPELDETGLKALGWTFSFGLR
jgi:hypothetical protein